MLRMHKRFRNQFMHISWEDTRSVKTVKPGGLPAGSMKCAIDVLANPPVKAETWDRNRHHPDAPRKGYRRKRSWQYGRASSHHSGLND